MSMILCHKNRLGRVTAVLSNPEPLNSTDMLHISVAVLRSWEALEFSRRTATNFRQLELHETKGLSRMAAL